MGNEDLHFWTYPVVNAFKKVVLSYHTRMRGALLYGRGQLTRTLPRSIALIVPFVLSGSKMR